MHQTHDKMNPRQMREYKHTQKVKAEEMRHKREQERLKAEHEEKMKKCIRADKLNEMICDKVEEAMETERLKAEWVFGKGAKGKMSVNVSLNDGRIAIKAVFTPAEGVTPIEGRQPFGITRNMDFDEEQKKPRWTPSAEGLMRIATKMNEWVKGK